MRLLPSFPLLYFPSEKPTLVTVTSVRQRVELKTLLIMVRGIPWTREASSDLKEDIWTSVKYSKEDTNPGSLGADAALSIGPIREKHSRLSHYICQLVRLVSSTGFQLWSMQLTSKAGPQVWSPGLPGFSSVHLIFTPSTFWVCF